MQLRVQICAPRTVSQRALAHSDALVHAPPSVTQPSPSSAEPLQSSSSPLQISRTGTHGGAQSSASSMSPVHAATRVKTARSSAHVPSKPKLVIPVTLPAVSMYGPPLSPWQVQLAPSATMRRESTMIVRIAPLYFCPAVSV